MSQVNQHLEEVRFEERVGGSFADRPDEKLFVIEKEAKTEEPKRNRKQPKKLRCFANLEGLPGVPDPRPFRNKTLTSEERENPIVKKMKLDKIKAGKIGKKTLEKLEARKKYLEKKEAGRKERSTRRRTEFDFDIWETEEKVALPSDDWVGKTVLEHTAKGKCQYVPKAANERNLSTGTIIPAVEVPESGASYNPSASEHQDLLWKAALVEIQKEKEQARIDRHTTFMFPDKGKAPTEKDYIQEMSEGIVEFKNEEEKKDDDEEEETKIEDLEVTKEEEESHNKMIKPKTRKQKRDKRGRNFEEQREKREKETRLREMEVMRTKSLKKQLTEENKIMEKNQRRRKQQKVDKMSGPLQLSNYKYEPQDIEIKLSDELCGNLRNLQPEGSILEDRFKSMQRRNMIEVRVKQRTVKKLKRKKFEKRGHKMGWEENKNVVAKRIRQEAKQRRKARKTDTIAD